MAYAPCKYIDLPAGKTMRKGDFLRCCAPLPTIDLSQFPYPVQHSWEHQSFRTLLARDSRYGLGHVSKENCAKCPCYDPRRSDGEVVTPVQTDGAL